MSDSSTPDYKARQIDERITQAAADIPGTLLRIGPNKDIERFVAAARLWTMLHNV